MGTGRGNVTGPRCDTPRAAAKAFFARYPLRKICHVQEYGVGPHGRLQLDIRKHRFWTEITTAQVDTLLPDQPKEVAA